MPSPVLFEVVWPRRCSWTYSCAVARVHVGVAVSCYVLDRLVLVGLFSTDPWSRSPAARIEKQMTLN